MNPDTVRSNVLSRAMSPRVVRLAWSEPSAGRSRPLSSRSATVTSCSRADQPKLASTSREIENLGPAVRQAVVGDELLVGGGDPGSPR